MNGFLISIATVAFPFVIIFILRYIDSVRIEKAKEKIISKSPIQLSNNVEFCTLHTSDTVFTFAFDEETNCFAWCEYTNKNYDLYFLNCSDYTAKCLPKTMWKRKNVTPQKTISSVSYNTSTGATTYTTHYIEKSKAVTKYYLSVTKYEFVSDTRTIKLTLLDSYSHFKFRKNDISPFDIKSKIQGLNWIKFMDTHEIEGY